MYYNILKFIVQLQSRQLLISGIILDIGDFDTNNLEIAHFAIAIMWRLHQN